MRRFFVIVLLITLTACSASPTVDVNPLPTTPVIASIPTGNSAPDASSIAPQADLFTSASITLPAPNCDAGFTPEDIEGPYFRASSPERYSLIEEGMTGTRLILVGYVLDQNCRPVPNAMLDFWQADANGEYDNTGYTLRGHQFTDEQGRYYLETISPGLYPSRPIIHIHVKVQVQGGEVVTTQIYFPEQSVENQTATLEQRDGYLVGYFNFVVQY